MPRNFVITLTGPDRIGIVEEVTRLVLGRGGNIDGSRMARLGGEFAVLMLVSASEAKGQGLDQDFEGLVARGYKVTIAPTETTVAPPHHGWDPYHIEVIGADHEGIIHEISRHLAEHGISIEEMDSESSPAPTSGAPLFSMRALVLVPPDVDAAWAEGLEQIGWRLNLEIDVEALPDEDAEEIGDDGFGDEDES